MEVKNLSKSFGGVAAVVDCSFSIDEGKIVALVGPNGSGKTTVFDLITGFVKPDNGQIFIKGESIEGLRPDDIAQKGLSRTFQLIRLFPKLTCLDNLLLAKPQRGENFWTALLKPFFVREEEKTNAKRGLEFLRLVGLEKKKNTLAENLSYGQQKLLEIARALATEGELFLLDEPMAGVHPRMRQKLKRVLRKLKDMGKTILFIEHDMKTVKDLAEQTIVLKQSRVAKIL